MTADATRRLIQAVPDFSFDVHSFPNGTKTAEDAAGAIGCEVSAIIKSLVFILILEDGSEEATVSLIPGDRRLDTGSLAATAGAASARRASLDEVKNATGYSAGGTPPFGHIQPLRVFADTLLKRNDPVWAAAGTPNSVFPISIDDVDRHARPIWADISE